MKVLSRILLVIVFIPLASSCVRHLNLQQGIESFKMQDYRRAFIRLKPEAEKGQPDAQYAIGYMYYYGRGVVEDREKAGFWINLAAKSSQPDAIQAAKTICPTEHCLDID